MIIFSDELAGIEPVGNSPDRCSYRKRVRFGTMKELMWSPDIKYIGELGVRTRSIKLTGQAGNMRDVPAA